MRFPLKFKEMDQESKAMAGVLVVFAIVVLGAVGLSQGQAETPGLADPGVKPKSTSRSSGGLPPQQPPGPTRAEKEKALAQAKTQTQAKQQKTQSAPAGPSHAESAPSRPTSTPVTPQPAPTSPTKPSAPKPKKAPKPAPKPAPSVSALSSARIRSLKAGESIDRVVAQIGPSLSYSALTSRFGEAPTQAMIGQEPAGRPCRYYLLAAGEPAPLARLCFDANGHLLTREFVAPAKG